VPHDILLGKEDDLMPAMPCQDVLVRSTGGLSRGRSDLRDVP